VVQEDQDGRIDEAAEGEYEVVAHARLVFDTNAVVHLSDVLPQALVVGQRFLGDSRHLEENDERVSDEEDRKAD